MKVEWVRWVFLVSVCPESSMVVAVRFLIFLLVVMCAAANDSLRLLREMDLAEEPHRYYAREANDRFARL